MSSLKSNDTRSGHPGAVRPSPPEPALAVMPIDLARWDRDGRGDLLAVFIWQDVRPLRGGAGLLDWRLCGKLSELIQSGRLTGREGEQLLLPAGGRLPWRFILVMGLGSRVGFAGARFRGAVARLFAAARGLDVHELAVAPPGRDVDALPARRAMDLIVAEAGAPDHRGRFHRLTIIETPAVQRELTDCIRSVPGPA
jgi:Cytosol aminopeptidase family, N-terminal domain